MFDGGDKTTMRYQHGRYQKASDILIRMRCEAEQSFSILARECDYAFAWTYCDLNALVIGTEAGPMINESGKT